VESINPGRQAGKVREPDTRSSRPAPARRDGEAPTAHWPQHREMPTVQPPTSAIDACLGTVLGRGCQVKSSASTAGSSDSRAACRTRRHPDRSGTLPASPRAAWTSPSDCGTWPPGSQSGSRCAAFSSARLQRVMTDRHQTCRDSPALRSARGRRRVRCVVGPRPPRRRSTRHSVKPLGPQGRATPVGSLASAPGSPAGKPRRRRLRLGGGQAGALGVIVDVR
jgi:hypothetical protein